ncbi:acylphosphatase [Thalassomonas sp. RHCl1]|uniref:acylphosphatase n=1 Tax=Thalassomonas sp. RHCl1 TaxID=2995320 RepID=UPI00248D3690|nr:acylphosphatase [Thalassomonas sp. RHCl1]
MKVCFSVTVSGLVQGVYFRASSQQVAIDYGLSGYARNLSDGNVELLICGEQDNVEKMLNWLKQGPPEAEVEDLRHEQVQWQDHNFFAIE